MPLRKSKLERRKAEMIRKHRIEKILQFYLERTKKATEKGESYMEDPNVKSLENMVAYRYPKLSVPTRMSYAASLLAIINGGSNESLWREVLTKHHSHWSTNDTLRGKQGIPGS